MTVLEAIRARLVADATVQSLVENRIYPQVIPQGSLMPAVVLSVIDERPINSLTGDPSTRLKRARLQVDCYAETYLEAHDVFDAVDNVISSLSDPELSAHRELSEDLYEDETQLYRVSSDFIVMM